MSKYRSKKTLSIRSPLAHQDTLQIHAKNAE